MTGASLEHWLLGLALALPRMLGMFFIVPLLSPQLFPGIMSRAIVAGLCVPLIPPMIPHVPEVMSSHLALGMFLLKETCIGLLLGIAPATIFWAFEAVGVFIDNQRGATISSSIDPVHGVDTSPLGALTQQVFLMMFLAIGGIQLLLGMVYESYSVWPIDTPWPVFSAKALSAAFGMLDQIVRIGLLLAAPVVTAMIVTEIGLAVISVFVPQFQVFFLAMPIKSLLAFVFLILYAKILVTSTQDQLDYIRSITRFIMV
ncbi:MAG: type III secretion system export apparatus subunit SctT [Burkholderiaceae bacterium]|nr:type III secretion system export apparatus subunit SctT [Burkholderiaceae bacterium]